MTHANPFYRVKASDVVSTGRIYARVQAAFAEWCQHQRVKNPDHADVARYLLHAAALRGPTSIPVHLSAIADLFRSQGRHLDTRAPVIQEVMGPIRHAINQRRSAKTPGK